MVSHGRVVCMVRRGVAPGMTALLLSAWLWTGCGAVRVPAEPMPAPDPVPYQCGDLRIEARFVKDRVDLLLPDRVLALPAAVSASGARYADGDGNVFWSKGVEATLTLEGADTVPCMQTDARSPWVEARERGVTYRAVGQEPGWLAEVGGGDTPPVRLVLDYGERVLDIPRSHRLPKGSGVSAEAGGVRVELHIAHEACRDTMSGERFTTRARLRVGERSYDGCGRFLQ